MVMLYPLACNNLPTEEDMIPLPNEEATPPVTKIYFVSPTMLLFFGLVFSDDIVIKLQNYKKLWVHRGFSFKKRYIFVSAKGNKDAEEVLLGMGHRAVAVL